MEPIFTSLLDTDLYKFTMWQTMLHRYPNNEAEYTFACRNDVDTASMLADVNEQLDHLCTLRFTDDELDYLGGLRFIKADFVDFLRKFQFNRDHVDASVEGGELRIVARGPQIQVMAFEVFVLAIVNELAFRGHEGALVAGRAILRTKIAEARERLAGAGKEHPFEVFDFGTRRRFSGAWHREVVETLIAELPCFKGTSNVLLAKELGITPIGTMAHEYLQMFQGFESVPLRNSQRAALEGWLQEYQGDLGIALTDVVGMDAFLADFDEYFANAFSGLRHDSGDPMVWGEKALAHYAKLGVNAHDKRLVFSDGLTLPKALDLYERFADRVQVGFGIGTNLTNDVGLVPLNVVMKITRCNGRPVAKLSDSPGKTMCDDPAFIERLRRTFDHTS